MEGFFHVSVSMLSEIRAWLPNLSLISWNCSLGLMKCIYVTIVRQCQVRLSNVIGFVKSGPCLERLLQ